MHSTAWVFVPLLENIEALSQTQLEGALESARTISEAGWEASNLLGNVSVYANCESSVDTRNMDARKLIASLDALGAQLELARKPYLLFMTLVPDAAFEFLMRDSKLAQEKFGFVHARCSRSTLLPLPEENLATALSVDGFTAWGRLYTDVSGGLTCHVDLPGGTEKMGVAKVAGLLSDARESVRKAAWQGQHRAWQTQEDTCAAILNSISGWRVQMNRVRSHSRPVHFLDRALHDNRISHQTLEAMNLAVNENLEVGRKALRLRAKALGKTQLDPWDFFAPAPHLGRAHSKKFLYADSIELIEKAFSAVHPDMGAFARMMNEKSWIEGRVGDSRRAGAYCAGFSKSHKSKSWGRTFTPLKFLCCATPAA